MKGLRSVLAAVTLLASFSAFAGKAEVLEAVKGKIVGGNDAQVQPAPIPGMFEVIASGQLYYATEDGRYLFQGNAFDLVEGKDLTKPRMNFVRAESLKSVDDAQAVVFSPEAKDIKYRVNVFTDIDCHYCRELHKQMAGYMERGIEVRYLFFPRAGVNSPSAKKAEAVWCADDSQTAMTDAKAFRKVEPRRCPNPVATHYNLGKELGVRATPTIMTDGGEVIPGFRPPEALEQILKHL